MSKVESLDKQYIEKIGEDYKESRPIPRHWLSSSPCRRLLQDKGMDLLTIWDLEDAFRQRNIAQGKQSKNWDLAFYREVVSGQLKGKAAGAE